MSRDRKVKAAAALAALLLAGTCLAQALPADAKAKVDA